MTACVGMKTVEFTHQRPSENGYYWWMCDQEQPHSPIMVDVHMHEKGDFYYSFIYVQELIFHLCDKCLWAKVPGPHFPHGAKDGEKL